MRSLRIFRSGAPVNSKTEQVEPYRSSKSLLQTGKLRPRGGGDLPGASQSVGHRASLGNQVSWALSRILLKMLDQEERTSQEEDHSGPCLEASGRDQHLETRQPRVNQELLA